MGDNSGSYPDNLPLHNQPHEPSDALITEMRQIPVGFLIIKREAGGNPEKDIAMAVKLLENTMI